MLKSFKLIPHRGGFWPFPITESEALALRAQNTRASRVQDRRGGKQVFIELFILCDDTDCQLNYATHLCFMHVAGLINLETYNGRPNRKQ